MKNLPKARNENIVTQEANNETLVYDLLTNKAYCLNETSAKVFSACGNNGSFEDLKRKHGFTDDLVYLSLDELKKNDLLQTDYDSPFAGVNRREVIRKVGLASMIALPVISALVAPSAANASSNCAPDTAPGQTQDFPAAGTCPGSCSNCQCARDYCNANAQPCCSGNPFATTNYNGLRVFCNC